MRRVALVVALILVWAVAAYVQLAREMGRSL